MQNSKNLFTSVADHTVYRIPLLHMYHIMSILLDVRGNEKIQYNGLYSEHIKQRFIYLVLMNENMFDG